MAKLKQKALDSFQAQLVRLPRAWVGGVLIILIFLPTIFAAQLSPADPLAQFREGLADNGTPLPPNERFPLGTDHLGRDMLSRLLYGGQISLKVSIIANTAAAVFGTAIGLLAGYYSGLLDTVLMRTTDILLAFPAILLALGLGSVLRPSELVVILILSIVTWPPLARLVRSQVLIIRERTFVESARASGAGDGYIILRHILPHTVTVTVVWGTLSFATAVLIESSLSFLGVGIPLPTASWGNMIAEGQSRYRIAPWMILAPTLAILMTTLGFNLLGDAIRDALDPHTSKRLN